MAAFILIIVGVFGVVAYATKHDASDAVAITQAAQVDPNLVFLAVVIVSQLVIAVGILWWKHRQGI